MTETCHTSLLHLFLELDRPLFLCPWLQIPVQSSPCDAVSGSNFLLSLLHGLSFEVQTPKLCHADQRVCVPVIFKLQGTSHIMSTNRSGPYIFLFVFFTALFTPLLHSSIRPVLEYCVPVWHYALTKTQTDHLEALQKRVIQIIFQSFT